MDWNKGEPRASLREEILALFKENEDQIWDLAKLRAELFPDMEMSLQFDDPGEMMNALEVIRATASIEAIVEILVDEGAVEKKEFTVDQISLFTYNEEEYEQVAKQWDDDPMTRRVYYKSA